MPFSKSGPTQEGQPELQAHVFTRSKLFETSKLILSYSEFESPIPPGTVSCSKTTGKSSANGAWLSENESKSLESHNTSRGAMFDNT